MPEQVRAPNRPRIPRAPGPTAQPPAAVKGIAPRADAPKVTLVEPGPVTHAARADTGRRDVADLARHLLAAPATEHVAVLGLLGVLAVPVVYAEGGRSAGAQGWFGAAVVAALVLTRPWNRLPRGWTVLAAALALPPLLVLAATHGGRSGAVAAASYGTSAGTLLVVAAYARSATRRAAVAAALCAGGVAQFAWALVPWWGGGDPSRPMVGSYDWHNQFAAGLLAPALLGLALVVAGNRPWRGAGLVAAPLAVAGVVLSTSRATLALLAVGWVVLVALALLGPGGRSGRLRVAGRTAAATALAVALTVALPGPPLFATSASALSGTAARAAAGETLASNSTYRTEFWREAMVAFRAHPVTGAGYGRITDAAQGKVPATWALSPLAHSGPLQALAEGGLLLGVPLLLAVAALGLGLLRRLRRPARAGTSAPAGDMLVVRAAALVGVLMLVHSLVDTDWSYPALAAQLAVVAGVALAGGLPAPAHPDGSGRPAARLAMAAGGVMLLALLAGTAASWGQPFHILDPPTMSGGGPS